MKDINLIVVAHPDDEILGFGATGAKIVDNGEVVQPIILCGGVNERQRKPSDEELYSDMIKANEHLGFSSPICGEFPNIRMNNVAHIELVRFIEESILKFSPKRIFTHHPNDLNNDHLQVSRACMAASRIFQRRNQKSPIKSLCFMEIPSATDWSYEYTGEGFKPNLYVEVDEYINKKIEALSFYRHVMRDYPHPRSKDSLKSLATYRGSQSGINMAEAFQCIFQTEL